MTTIEKQNAAMDESEAIFKELTRLGLASYATWAGKKYLWLPWTQQVFDLKCATAVKDIGHVLVMIGWLLPSNPLRKYIVADFIELCSTEADDITSAPQIVRDKIHALRKH